MTTTVKTEIIIDYRKANNLTVEEFCKKMQYFKTSVLQIDEKQLELSSGSAVQYREKYKLA